MLRLDLPEAGAGGVLAFYAIVNFSRDEAAVAIREMARVLRPGGLVLLSFHVGSEVRHLDEFLGSRVPIDFTFFETAEVVAMLEAAGFAELDARVREPYPGVEHPSVRAYLSARKAERPGVVPRAISVAEP